VSIDGIELAFNNRETRLANIAAAVLRTPKAWVDCTAVRRYTDIDASNADIELAFLYLDALHVAATGRATGNRGIKKLWLVRRAPPSDADGDVEGYLAFTAVLLAVAAELEDFTKLTTPAALANPPNTHVPDLPGPAAHLLYTTDICEQMSAAALRLQEWRRAA